MNNTMKITKTNSFPRTEYYKRFKQIKKGYDDITEFKFELIKIVVSSFDDIKHTYDSDKMFYKWVGPELNKLMPEKYPHLVMT